MTVRQRRRKWLEQYVAVRELEILEFGAFDYPTYGKGEVAIEYLDYFSKAELAQLHGAIKPDRVKNAIQVDHVIKEIDFAQHLPKRYDVLIAHHVIEHVADPIRWLENAARSLRSEGRVFLSIPDKEYTFDRARPLTTLSDLLFAHEEKLTKASVKQIFESQYYYRPIRARHIWDEDPELEKLMRHRRHQSARVAWEVAREKIEKGQFFDVHCTVFTYQSFLDLMSELEQAGYTRLKVIQSERVQPNSNEFRVLLR